ncbi:hypothetical protein RIF29_31922 [Crotalaria pallida]|uniref:Uncharacterized protein n=1 Tax=Crotalaria pallida TaxID=3830 RepID=A0AAN9EHL5_CROPI
MKAFLSFTMATSTHSDGPEEKGVQYKLVLLNKAENPYVDVEEDFIGLYGNELGVHWNIYNTHGTRYVVYYFQGMVIPTGRINHGWEEFRHAEGIQDGAEVHLNYMGNSRFEYIPNNA